MANFYDDNADLRWYVERGIDWEPLVRFTEYDWRAEDGFTNVDEAKEFYAEVLDLVGRFAAEEIAPRAHELDAAHPEVVDGEVVQPPIVDELTAAVGELGVHGLCLPRELDGMNAPVILMQLNHELLARADVSICAHIGFHGGMALAALMYSIMEGTTEFQTDPPRITRTRFADAIAEIAAGEAFGSMDITEPGAGSDMAALRTKGELGDDGVWRVTGQKIFITSGHGKYHFVIARTEPKTGDGAFDGLDGLSMFLVPAYETDDDGNRVRLSTIDGVEDKLGHNASATVAISFENTPAHLIGERGEGFKYMLLLMNNARVGVGFESLGLAEAAYRAARAYAEQRPSMGKTIDRHEMIADLLDEMKTDIQAIRALAVQGAWHEELAQKLRLAVEVMEVSEDERAELENQRKHHAHRARHLTPLLKWYGSEKAVEIARRAIQIHGGCGYMKEYGVEKLLRDAVVFPIYEGTSQIQALMAMKDNLMHAVRHPRRFVRRTARARWKSLSARDPLERRVAALRLTAQQAMQYLLSRLAASKIRDLPISQPTHWAEVMKDWDPKRDFALAMLHAERLTGILTDAAIAEVIWEQARKDPERRELLERFLDRAEPRTRYLHDQITTTGPRLLATLVEPLAQAAK